MHEAMIQKYGEDLSKHPSSDLELWSKVTGGKPHGNLYGMGSSVDCRVRRAPRSFEPKFPTQAQSSSNYIDRETAKKMFEAQKVELRHEAKLREDKRDWMFIKRMNRAILENQRTFMLAMLNLRNDGASTSAPFSKRNRSSRSNSDCGILPSVRGNKASQDLLNDGDKSDESDASDASNESDGSDGSASDSSSDIN